MDLAGATPGAPKGMLLNACRWPLRFQIGLLNSRNVNWVVSTHYPRGVDHELSAGYGLD